ncbi:LysR family transcriptional regulator [Luteibacter aegosomaticola]|uniref:LysR family transcriptional regulator n=1 Tax=Luteibacter aegosomaticola TaxID=2911538 RepID=UPI001FFAB22D|nr:LysR family transcriptional regulator [Luteibacter aegosomaticola]UPG90530.1 LysR family transcriptional regulator [Luteibacter aegosomaticola]
MDHVSAITVFVRAAEARSFVAAGNSLGISASAVGKRIAALEQKLGVRLLHRTTRRVSVTDEGRLFLERCRRILDELQDAEDMLSRTQEAPRGTLRVGLPIIGYRFLLPVLPLFRERYPDIELDLDFNDRIVDIVDSGLDVVIRSGILSDSSLVSRLLGPFRFTLCASPAYLARHGEPLDPDALRHHHALRFRFPTTSKLQPWRLLGIEGDAGAEVPTALTCNNMEALRAATLGGMGIAYMPDFLTHESLEKGELVPLLEAWLSQPSQFSVLWPSSRQLSPKVRVFVDFLCEHLFQ